MLDKYIDSITSYGLSLVMMLIGSGDYILTLGGILLLIVRFIKDGPGAIRNLKGWFGYGSKRKPTRRAPRKGRIRNGADTGSSGESTG